MKAEGNGSKSEADLKKKRSIEERSVRQIMHVQLSGRESGPETNKFTISGGNDERDPPVPIPNTEVKPLSADGTWLATARESRSPPDTTQDVRNYVLFFVFGRKGRFR